MTAHSLTIGFHRTGKPPRGYAGKHGQPLLDPAGSHSHTNSKDNAWSLEKGVVGPAIHRGTALSAFSAVLYGTVAVVMNFVNKATVLAFPFPTTLLFLQMIVTVLILLPLKFAGVVQIKSMDWDRARHLLPVTLLYTANTGFALAGLQALNIPMYNALKRLSPIIVLVLKALMTRKAPSTGTTLSVTVIVAGCVVAASGDLAFDARGYVCALLSCLLQASYLLLVETTGAEKGITTAELLEYNALLSLPFLGILMLVTGEAWTCWGRYAAAQAQNPLFTLLVALCSALGVLLNFALFFCTVYNSALTTTVVGVLKGVFATVLGFFWMNHVQFHWVNALGIGMNMAGGVWYSVVKYAEKLRKKGMGQPLLPVTASMDPLNSAASQSGSVHGSFGSGVELFGSSPAASFSFPASNGHASGSR